MSFCLLGCSYFEVNSTRSLNKEKEKRKRKKYLSYCQFKFQSFKVKEKFPLTLKDCYKCGVRIYYHLTTNEVLKPTFRGRVVTDAWRRSDFKYRRLNLELNISSAEGKSVGERKSRCSILGVYCCPQASHSVSMGLLSLFAFVRSLLLISLLRPKPSCNHLAWIIL